MDIPSPIEQTRPPKKENFIIETIKFILLALIIVLPVRLLIAEPFIVSGGSMDPTFRNAQYLIVDRLTGHFEDYRRGEVIVFRPPIDPDKYYIKRLMGLPGETIEVRGTDVYVSNVDHPNAVKLEQPFVNIGTKKQYNQKITLGADEYFVMGDNRDFSSDSRDWGAITLDEIIGRPAVRLFPFQKLSVYPGEYDYKF